MAHLGYLQLTRECVQNCLFCSNPPTGVDLDAAGITASLDRFVELGCDGVILTGGEPTMSPLLLEALAASSRRGLSTRIITNGQLLAERDLLAACIDRGLSHLHLSLYSFRPGVHDSITRNPGSWRRAIQCLENAGAARITCDVNTVICRPNGAHLHETVAWLCKRFPFLRHFVWNNLDSSGERARAVPETVAHLSDFEVSLELAMDVLQRRGSSYRAERVPLCAMRQHAWASTETRKIIKGEARSVRFLDSRGFFHQESFDYDKGSSCSVCRFTSICAGLFLAGQVLSLNELSPIFEDPWPVVRHVLGHDPSPDELARLRARGLEDPRISPGQRCREAQSKECLGT